jgi:crotonobetainyl-CoA:carnitine CoA-transferase CaiB-like acyl-CoA transferase
MTLPLEGIKVLEIAQTVAAPFSGQILGDLGADVIKVEKPTGDESRSFTPPVWDGESIVYLANNRNKRSIVIDLKEPEGIDVIYDLVRKSDVVIENFRTGTAERLGIGYEKLKLLNPSLIYLSISGFGRTGPERERAGYDLMMQAYSGLMSVTGEPDGGPVKVGPPVVDLTAGLSGAMSVLAALLTRIKTGEGQFLDCSLLDGQMMMLNYLIPTYFGTGKSPGKMGVAPPTICPYQAFKAKDQHVIIACANDGLWEKLCIAFDWDDLLLDQRFTKNTLRVKHRQELIPIMSERLAEFSCKDICQKLDDAGVPNSPINSIGQVITNPQTVARKCAVDIPHPEIENLKGAPFPVKMSAGEATVRRHPPSLGEHTLEILMERGYSKEKIAKLMEMGVIVSASNK